MAPLPHDYINNWNAWDFIPPLCTYRLNWAWRTSWGWWDAWDSTAFQIQDAKFEPWRSEAEYVTSRSRRLPTIVLRVDGKKYFCFFQTAETGNELRALAGFRFQWKTNYYVTNMQYVIILVVKKWYTVKVMWRQNDIQTKWHQCDFIIFLLGLRPLDLLKSFSSDNILVRY